jgi:hypothetical protein
MAASTKLPKMLRELLKALDSDPYCIAECLARPVLTENRLRALYAGMPGSTPGRKPWPGGTGRLRVGGHTRRPAWRVPGSGVDFRRTEGRGSGGGIPQGIWLMGLDPEAWPAILGRLTSEFHVIGPTEERRSSGADPLIGSLKESQEGFSARILLGLEEERMRMGSLSWPKASFDRWRKEECGRLAVSMAMGRKDVFRESVRIPASSRLLPDPLSL